MENKINELVEKCRQIRDDMLVQMSDDALLIHLRKQLDSMLGANDEALPMEVYTFVVMRAFRVLKEGR